MKKKTLAVLFLVMGMTIGMLAGCGSNETPEEPSAPVVQPTPIVKEEPSEEAEEETEEAAEEENKAATATIIDREVVDGKMQSYLTGEWKDEAVAKRRSMAVMMPNNKPALPQYGISKASVIYEAPVEGRVTRLMCFVEDYDDMDHIGPVRSARDYYLYEAMAFDAIYCNWGLAIPFVAPIINTDRIDNVSQSLQGIDKGAPEAYDRISRPGYATEFTGYMFIDGYNDAVERLGYETEYRDTFVQAFTFANDGHRAEYEDMPDATLVYPGGSNKSAADYARSGYGDAASYFEYNEEDGLYYRYQFGGPQLDEMNGEHLAVSNVVFKVCYGEVREPADKDYLAFGVHGEGKAYVFTNGKVIEGTWTRNSDYEPNIYYDKDGNEIVFNQGKTWVCNIWEKYADLVSYE